MYLQIFYQYSVVCWCQLINIEIAFPATILIQTIFPPISAIDIHKHNLIQNSNALNITTYYRNAAHPHLNIIHLTYGSSIISMKGSIRKKGKTRQEKAGTCCFLTLRRSALLAAQQKSAAFIIGQSAQWRHRGMKGLRCTTMPDTRTYKEIEHKATKRIFHNASRGKCAGQAFLGAQGHPNLRIVLSFY